MRRRVSRLDRRARRALDVPEVPVPAPDRLARLRRRQGLGRLLRRAARPAQRRDRDGDAARPGRVRTVLRDTRAARRWPPAAGARAGREPLGAAHRDALRRGADGRAGARPGDHLERGPDPAHGAADRGRRHGRGTPGDADASLLDRRAGDPDGRQPHRRDDQQSRPDRDVDRPGRTRPDPGTGSWSTTACSTGSRWRSVPTTRASAAPPHSLPGQMPLEVTIRDARGETVDVLRRDD